MKRSKFAVFAVALILSMVISFLPATALPVGAVSDSIVISQVYGGGGNSGAQYKNDFVELFNRGTNPVSVNGWSVQYASATGTGNFGANSGQMVVLSGTIAPGQYYLVQLGGGTNGVALPTPDATGTIAASATAGKFALVMSNTGLGCNGGSTPCNATQLSLIKDLVGYGGANFFEGSPAPLLSNTTAGFRNGNGCVDTDNNAADFTKDAPAPRNSASPLSTCAGPTNPSGTGTANPEAVFAGEATLLSVAVTGGENPTSTGLGVTCDLTGIGGAELQAFYDDGTNGDEVAGDNTFSFATTVADGTSGGVKSLACTITDAESRIGAVPIVLTVNAILPIGAVNGVVLDTEDGLMHVSPYVGQYVTIKGVIFETTLQAISNSINTYKGFFIQNTAATADGDPLTSDGLFVFMSTRTTLTGPDGAYTPTIGDEIILSGKVSEYYNMTELVSTFQVLSIVRSGVELDAEIIPVVANPPSNLAEANRYWERLQGSRVQVPVNSIVLGGRSVFSPADAEVWVANTESTIAQRILPYTNRAFRDAHPLDNNYDPVNWDGNGYRILMGSLGIKGFEGDAEALIAPARTFDTVANAPSGGLNYTYSKYRIEISNQAEFNEGPDPSLNNPPQAFDRSLYYSIADYNLENLYDYRDNPFSGCDFAGNTGCPVATPFTSAVKPPYDYVPASEASYLARLNDIALEIINDLHNPDILMVQEVENEDFCTVTDGALTCGVTDNADGKPDVLQELALTIANLGGPEYEAAFDRDSSDLRGIAPAFLYRIDRVELVDPTGDPILGENPVIGGYTGVADNGDISNPKTLNALLPSGVSACETSWVFPRAPGIGLFRIYSNSLGVGSYRDVYVINNHFKSTPTSCIAHRTEQANYNAALVAFIQGTDPEARIVVGGDLNVYPRPDDIEYGASDQLGALYDPVIGMTNLWDVLVSQAPESAYSYVYLGMAQTLDQMFLNGTLLADLQQYRVAHINSDFPAEYAEDVARGTSDHDPGVAVFIINDPPTVDAGGPYTVIEGASVPLTATGSDPEFGTLSYAWDLDQDGIFETPGESVTFDASALSAPAIYIVTVQVTDPGGLVATDSATVTVIFNWMGFFSPVDNPPDVNTVKAGSSVPVKFSLGGYQGMDLFAEGSPTSVEITCDTGEVVGTPQSISFAGASHLTYHPLSELYQFVWKTEKGWSGTCRRLLITLIDGTLHFADFKLK